MFGFSIIALALFHMTSLDLQMSFAYAAKLRFLQSIGLAFLFVPINTLIYVGVPPGKNNEVSGLSNLARNSGGSTGTSFFTTVLARHQQIHQQYLVQHVQASSPACLQQAGSLARHFLTSTAAVADAQTSDSDYLPISANTGQRLELYRHHAITQCHLRLHDLLGPAHEATTEGNTGGCSINLTSRDGHTGEHP